jgi:hypothetical protein
VKKLGTLAVRTLRAVFASDGELDGEESRAIAALTGALALPDADAATLYSEAPMRAEDVEVLGEVEIDVARAIVRGAWFAAAWDALDPREEHAIRVIAGKLAVPAADVESLRNEAIARVDGRRAAGLAAIDAVRFVLGDGEESAQLARAVGELALPRRHRTEALAPLEHAAPVVLAGRHRGLPMADKLQALSIAYALALRSDPTIARQALLRARLDRFSVDLGANPADARKPVDQALAIALGELAATLP